MALCFLAVANVPAVKAEIADCTVIEAVPYTITVQGVYCFKHHVATSLSSGNTITIETNNVIIDMNGYKLGGLAAGPNTEAIGIYADQRKNITIRNGSIRGFAVGIFFQDFLPYTTSQGHLVEKIRIDGDTIGGIFVAGRGSVIRDNTVTETGGAALSTIAILAVGAGVQVENNAIVDAAETQASGAAWGIQLDNATGARVMNNHIANSALGPGVSYGIYMSNSDGVSVLDNQITNMTYGVYFATIGTGASGKYRDNVTYGVSVPYQGGTDIGNND